MTVCAVVRDLLLASRILEAGARAGVAVQRLDSPAQLPPPADVALVLVDWSDRDADWGGQLAEWRAATAPHPPMVLFGPHTDLQAHAEAKTAGLGPMWARSKLVTELPTLFASSSRARDSTQLDQSPQETP